MATIKPIEIHKFIQEHDNRALDGSKQNSGPLFLETLGIHEFCNIALLACIEEIAFVLDRLKTMAGELTGILEQDDREMIATCEKARLIGSILKRQPSQVATQTPARNVVRPSQLHKNPMFQTSFFKKEDLKVIDIQFEGKCGIIGFEDKIGGGTFVCSFTSTS